MKLTFKFVKKKTKKKKGGGRVIEREGVEVIENMISI